MSYSFCQILEGYLGIGEIWVAGSFSSVVEKYCALLLVSIVSGGKSTIILNYFLPIAKEQYCFFLAAFKLFSLSLVFRI